MRQKLLLIGLGNPGKKYDHTRHNAGKMFAAYLKRYPIDGLEAIESEEYMNTSGGYVVRMVRKLNRHPEAAFGGRGDLAVAAPSEIATSPRRGGAPRNDSVDRSPSFENTLSFPHLILAHDDLDLPLGRVKLQFGRGPRVHGGVASVEAALATTEFWRLRIGIDNRNPEAREMYIGKDYVLSVFTRGEKKILEQGFEEAVILMQRNFQF